MHQSMRDDPSERGPTRNQPYFLFKKNYHIRLWISLKLASCCYRSESENG